MDRYIQTLIFLSTLAAGLAHADTLTSVPDGGQMVISQSWSSTAAGQTPATASGTGVNGDATGVSISDLSAAAGGTFIFNQTLSNPKGSFAASGTTAGGTPFGFTASYVFDVPASVSASAFLFSLNLGSSSGLSNLTARLYAYGPGQNLTLGGTGSVTGLIQDWTGGVGSTQVSLPESTLAGGEYVLQIAGIETGSRSGTLSGQLSIAPSATTAPLPAALPLLASALGGFGLLARRRRTAG